MTATTPAKADVLTPYRRFHQVVERALALGDASQVTDVATGAVAARIKDGIAADRRAGVVQRGHAVPNPRVAALRPDSARIIDCVLTAGPYTYRRDTGRRVGTAPAPRRYLAYATLTRTGGTWKVSELIVPDDSRC
ncbi:hypothetical protein DZF91_07755 [Actinomadura logoneensis]|uniref:Uncharacterized protein n=2 Tax=Actinomadura logoneensis TaxID=2293572 RepID=A0A372JQB9_9ACTN|nr:hypothetical protein DZF91_07755 [Actinomadura logoneensis]